MRSNFSSLTSRKDILCRWENMESENTWMAESLIVEMSTPMTMTMNIHLTMTMNILFTIMWMQTATVEVGRHPEESAVPPWLRCSSDNDHEYTFYDYVDANGYCRSGTPP